jgi:hypothetical protein
MLAAVRERCCTLLLYRLAARLVGRDSEVRRTDSPTFRFQVGHIPSWPGSCECPALSPVAVACRWSLLLLSPLLSAAIRRAGGRAGLVRMVAAYLVEGIPLIGRREVGVPVDELPLAVNAPVYMG